LYDENTREAEEYASICRNICEKQNVPAEFKIYADSGSLLFDMEDDAFRALVSILIVEPETKLITIADTVRKLGFDGLILYLSYSRLAEHYHQAFDVEAYNYLQKGTDEKSMSRFESVFVSSLNAAQELERQYIVLNCAGEYKQIDIKDIYYFEAAMEHMISIVYRGGDFKFPSTLQNLGEQLGSRGFARSHRSYIVALSAIQTVKSNELILYNGQRIPVSRSYYSNLKSAIDRWAI